MNDFSNDGATDTRATSIGRGARVCAQRVAQSRIGQTAIVASVAALLLGGVAHAAIPDSTGVIHACYLDKNAPHVIRIIDSEIGQQCASYEKHLNWSQTGPKGDKGDSGAAGAQGIQGPKGDTGVAGTQGIQGLKGDTGPTGAPGAPGTKGDIGPGGIPGVQGLKGDSGPAGSPGVPGAPGLPGTIGAQGPAGPQGAQGESGTSSAYFVHKAPLLGLNSDGSYSDAADLTVPTGGYIVTANITAQVANGDEVTCRLTSQSTPSDGTAIGVADGGYFSGTTKGGIFNISVTRYLSVSGTDPIFIYCHSVTGGSSSISDVLLTAVKVDSINGSPVS